MPDLSLEETVELVRCAQRGDSEAREALFRRFLPRLRQVVSLRLGRKLRDLSGVDDIVQEALLNASRALESFQIRSEGTFLNWLGELALNSWNDNERKRSAQKRGEGREQPFANYESGVLSSSIMPACSPSPSQVAMARELEHRIEQAVLGLPDRHRRVIDMRLICGMSYVEIADALSMEGSSSARSLYSRALAELSGTLRLFDEIPSRDSDEE